MLNLSSDKPNLVLDFTNVTYIDSRREANSCVCVNIGRPCTLIR